MQVSLSLYFALLLGLVLTILLCRMPCAWLFFDSDWNYFETTLKSADNFEDSVV